MRVAELLIDPVIVPADCAAAGLLSAAPATWASARATIATIDRPEGWLLFMVGGGSKERLPVVSELGLTLLVRNYVC